MFWKPSVKVTVALSSFAFVVGAYCALVFVLQPYAASSIDIAVTTVARQNILLTSRALEIRLNRTSEAIQLLANTTLSDLVRFPLRDNISTSVMTNALLIAGLALGQINGDQTTLVCRFSDASYSSLRLVYIDSPTASQHIAAVQHYQAFASGIYTGVKGVQDVPQNVWYREYNTSTYLSRDTAAAPLFPVSRAEWTTFVNGEFWNMSRFGSDPVTPDFRTFSSSSSSATGGGGGALSGSFCYPMPWMVLDGATGKPHAYCSSFLRMSSFSQHMNQYLLGGSDARSYLLDQAGRVMAFSHGDPFLTIENYSTATGGHVYDGCYTFGQTMACLWNISEYRPYRLLHRVMDVLPYNSYLDPQETNSVLLVMEDGVDGDRYYTAKQLPAHDDVSFFFTTSAISKRVIYTSHLTRLALHYKLFAFRLYFFIPLDYYMDQVRGTTVYAVSMAGALCFFALLFALIILRVIFKSVEELAEKMYRDPWEATEKTIDKNNLLAMKLAGFDVSSMGEEESAGSLGDDIEELNELDDDDDDDDEVPDESEGATADGNESGIGDNDEHDKNTNTSNNTSRSSTKERSKRRKRSRNENENEANGVDANREETQKNEAASTSGEQRKQRLQPSNDSLNNSGDVTGSSSALTATTTTATATTKNSKIGGTLSSPSSSLLTRKPKKAPLSVSNLEQHETRLREKKNEGKQHGQPAAGGGGPPGKVFAASSSSILSSLFFDGAFQFEEVIQLQVQFYLFRRTIEIMRSFMATTLPNAKAVATAASATATDDGDASAHHRPPPSAVPAGCTTGHLHSPVPSRLRRRGEKNISTDKAEVPSATLDNNAATTAAATSFSTDGINSTSHPAKRTPVDSSPSGSELPSSRSNPPLAGAAATTATTTASATKSKPKKTSSTPSGSKNENENDNVKNNDNDDNINNNAKGAKRVRFSESSALHNHGAGQGQPMLSSPNQQNRSQQQGARSGTGGAAVVALPSAKHVVPFGFSFLDRQKAKQQQKSANGASSPTSGASQQAALFPKQLFCFTYIEFSAVLVPILKSNFLTTHQLEQQRLWIGPGGFVGGDVCGDVCGGGGGGGGGGYGTSASPAVPGNKKINRSTASSPFPFFTSSSSTMTNPTSSPTPCSYPSNEQVTGSSATSFSFGYTSPATSFGTFAVSSGNAFQYDDDAAAGVGGGGGGRGTLQQQWQDQNDAAHHLLHHHHHHHYRPVDEQFAQELIDFRKRIAEFTSTLVAQTGLSLIEFFGDALLGCFRIRSNFQESRLVTNLVEQMHDLQDKELRLQRRREKKKMLREQAELLRQEREKEQARAATLEGEGSSHFFLASLDKQATTKSSGAGGKDSNNDNNCNDNSSQNFPLISGDTPVVAAAGGGDARKQRDRTKLRQNDNGDYDHHERDLREETRKYSNNDDDDNAQQMAQGARDSDTSALQVNGPVPPTPVALQTPYFKKTIKEMEKERLGAIVHFQFSDSAANLNNNNNNRAQQGSQPDNRSAAAGVESNMATTTTTTMSSPSATGGDGARIGVSEMNTNNRTSNNNNNAYNASNSTSKSSTLVSIFNFPKRYVHAYDRKNTFKAIRLYCGIETGNARVLDFSSVIAHQQWRDKDENISRPSPKIPTKTSSFVRSPASLDEDHDGSVIDDSASGSPASGTPTTPTGQHPPRGRSRDTSGKQPLRALTFLCDEVSDSRKICIEGRDFVTKRVEQRKTKILLLRASSAPTVFRISAPTTTTATTTTTTAAMIKSSRAAPAAPSSATMMMMMLAKPSAMAVGAEHQVPSTGAAQVFDSSSSSANPPIHMVHTVSFAPSQLSSTSKRENSTPLATVCAVAPALLIPNLGENTSDRTISVAGANAAKKSNITIIDNLNVNQVGDVGPDAGANAGDEGSKISLRAKSSSSSGSSSPPLPAGLRVRSATNTASTSLSAESRKNLPQQEQRDDDETPLPNAIREQQHQQPSDEAKIGHDNNLRPQLSNGRNRHGNDDGDEGNRDDAANHTAAFTDDYCIAVVAAVLQETQPVSRILGAHDAVGQMKIPPVNNLNPPKSKNETRSFSSPPPPLLFGGGRGQEPKQQQSSSSDSSAASPSPCAVTAPLARVFADELEEDNAIMMTPTLGDSSNNSKNNNNTKNGNNNNNSGSKVASASSTVANCKISTDFQKNKKQSSSGNPASAASGGVAGSNGKGDPKQSPSFVNVFIPGSVVCLLPAHWRYTRLKQIEFPKRAPRWLSKKTASGSNRIHSSSSASIQYGDDLNALESFSSSRSSSSSMSLSGAAAAAERQVQQLLKVEVVKQELIDGMRNDNDGMGDLL